jgi:hypothetical protein
MAMEWMTNLCKTLASLRHELQAVHKGHHAASSKDKPKKITQRKADDQLGQLQIRIDSLEKRIQELFTG